MSASGNFISNNEIKINCSNLVTSAIDGEVLFSAKFVPDGVSFYIPYRLFDIFIYDKIAESIFKFDDAKCFIQKFINSFICNDWFSLEWVNRLIAKMNVILHDKASLMNEIDGLNMIQLISLYGKDIVKFSPMKLLNIVPYELAPTSKRIMLLTDITYILEKKFIDYPTMLKYFDISENIIKEFSEMGIADILDISFFNLGFDDSELREQVYKVMDRVKELNEEIFEFFAVRFREIENELRFNLNYNSVGSLFSESLLFNRIKNELPEFQVISQFSPAWLSPQRFDIFIKEKNCAIEYNGIQHYEPIDYFGGEEGFKNTTKRDKAKRRKCKANNCYLMEIKYDEDFEVSIRRIYSTITRLP